MTIVGTFSGWDRRNDVGAVYIESTPYLGEVTLAECAVTVSRPVSPLPDQPGAVGTARLYGGTSRRRVFFIIGNGGGYWVDEEGNEYQPQYLSDYEPELPPAGAGVDEGGKP